MGNMREVYAATPLHNVFVTNQNYFHNNFVKLRKGTVTDPPRTAIHEYPQSVSGRNDALTR
jgi:hypothetical protein